MAVQKKRMSRRGGKERRKKISRDLLPADIEALIGKAEKEQDGKPFELKATYVFVTWVRSIFGEDRIPEFERRLVKKLPANTNYFGCMELHRDGASHYHVLIQFDDRKHYRNARKAFMLDEHDTNGIRFVKMDLGQKAEHFVAGVTGYIKKKIFLDHGPDDGEGTKKPDHWFFGKEIVVETERLRKHLIGRSIDMEKDFGRAKQRLREEDPWGFMRSYNNYMNYLNGEKVRTVEPREVPDYLTEGWKVPWELQEWTRKNIDERQPGRGNCLLLIGAPRTGKTQWALSFGKPMEMEKKWNMRSFRLGATHIVVSDCDVRNFGFGGDSYWREVMGCQMKFSASDKFMETRELQWGGVPCIWTCNEDLNPMVVAEVREYLETSGDSVTVYNLGSNRLY